jgi:hypothetical protein
MSSVCSQATFGVLAQIDCTLDAAGTYTILVGDFGADGTGNYQLYLQRTNDPVNFIPINYGGVVTGTIDLAVRLDTYTFPGNSGDRVRFSMNMTSGTLDPSFDVFRPDGSLLCSQATFGVLAQTDCALDAAGTYTILVGDFGADGTGNYQLYLQRTNDPVNFIPINYGEVVTGTIDLAVRLDTYTFPGNSGDQVRFSMNMTSGNLDPSFDVFRPDGSLLCSQATFGVLAQIDCTLDTTGTYTILVGDFGADGTGDYEFVAEKLN